MVPLFFLVTTVVVCYVLSGVLILVSLKMCLVVVVVALLLDHDCTHTGCCFHFYALGSRVGVLLRPWARW